MYHVCFLSSRLHWLLIYCVYWTTNIHCTYCMYCIYRITNMLYLLCHTHPVSVTRFPSFRTQTLENLSHYLWNKWVPEQPRPWRKSCERESCDGDRVYDCPYCTYCIYRITKSHMLYIVYIYYVYIYVLNICIVYIVYIVFTVSYMLKPRPREAGLAPTSPWTRGGRRPPPSPRSSRSL